MKVTGIVAEYNPLHNGHCYQLQQARQQTQADVIIVCMSGNYVQRGETAILDKWTRAQLALAAGADIVVELPFASAVQPADRFAQGAIALLAQLGCQMLAFGSEQPTFDYQTIGQKVSQLPARTAAFVDYQKTYATQLNEYYQQTLNLKIDQPNHLLGISYAVANAQLAQPMTLVPISRQVAQHGDQAIKAGQYASASAIRRAIWQSSPDLAAIAAVVPPTTMDQLQGNLGPQQAQLWPLLQYRINSMPLTELRQIYQMSEGLEYRFKKVLPQVDSYPALLQALKTKRYTYARLQRVCLYVLLNIKQAEIERVISEPYIRLLGFNRLGQNYLHQIKKTLTWPLLSKISAKIGAETGLLGLEVRVDRLWEQFTGTTQNFARQPIFYQRKDAKEC